MIKLIFLVYVCIQISNGYYEGLAGFNNLPSIENSGGPKWPVPIHYGEPQVQRRKPCPHRRSNAQASEQWIPSFRSLVTKPLDNYVQEPQALKHENVENTADESEVSKSVPTVDLTLNNKINSDPINDSIILDRPNRRSNAEERPDSGEQSLNEDYDCDMDLDTKDYFDSQNGAQNSKAASDTSALVGVEQKVIEMLRDCINKKQKYIEDKLNKGEEAPITGSRRSMGDLDSNNADLKSVSDENKQEGTNRSGDPLDPVLISLDNNTNTNISSMPNKEYETPSFTLRPGKLFNELQNPARTTGIADLPSRRMTADNARICYACSTSTNSACWEPNNKTTIKYCHTNQNCVTKSFGVKNSLTILRDCATSCDATSIPGIEPKYKSCSVCYNDYCNSAATNKYNLAIVFLITAVKCTF